MWALVGSASVRAACVSPVLSRCFRPFQILGAQLLRVFSICCVLFVDFGVFSQGFRRFGHRHCRHLRLLLRILRVFLHFSLFLLPSARCARPPCGMWALVGAVSVRAACVFFAFSLGFCRLRTLGVHLLRVFSVFRVSFGDFGVFSRGSHRFGQRHRRHLRLLRRFLRIFTGFSAFWARR